MNKIITNFKTYHNLLEDKKLKKDLFRSVEFILDTRIRLTTKVTTSDDNLIVFPVSIKTIPITLHNGVCNNRIAHYNPNLKVITLFYNFYNTHSFHDLLSTLIHEYGHAYLFDHNIYKLTDKDYDDQHEFFSQMLSFLYSCKIFEAKRDALYLLVRAKTRKEQRPICGCNDLLYEYLKKPYFHKVMIKLCKSFLRCYPPDKEFVEIASKSS
jgi:hypothetical protein